MPTSAQHNVARAATERPPGNQTPNSTMRLSKTDGKAKKLSRAVGMIIVSIESLLLFCNMVLPGHSGFGVSRCFVMRRPCFVSFHARYRVIEFENEI